uniref:Non-specific serine/threonine protein kinase n=1 Tax=Romanomermis culicivorax TaxID=13658 RepID=A0A915HME3_ROMCU
MHYLESVGGAFNDEVSSYIDSILKKMESSDVMENFVAHVGLLRDPGLLFSELKPRLVAILGDKLNKIVSLQQLQDLKDLIEKTTRELSSVNIKFKSLADYSTWLKNFDSSKYLLEIPGQYNVDSKPDPSEHILIESFDDEVIFLVGVYVFQSLRKPRTLTMKGNNGVNYKFLIKVGEDLRQDQRLQRIFSEMNGLLSLDAVSRKLGCKVEIYGIFPLSTNVGIIQMLENVESLKDFMIRSEPKRGYVNNFMTTRSIVNICKSPESFFTLRQQFVASYSTMCVAHYILGIGDRHLDNFLINYRTCTIVGIDFGYVFGTSVQILGVPELVPFRLTKQITDVVEPLGVRAFFQPHMTRCMKILRENSDSLMNILDVFVKEPTINWIHEAKKQSVQMSIEGQIENCELKFELDWSANIHNIDHWYPKQKMQTVWRKFRGDNPVLILQEEINLSRKNQIVGKNKLFPVDKILNVIHNARLPLRYPKSRLTPENQVECLINLATDPLILARMYIGWESWF